MDFVVKWGHITWALIEYLPETLNYFKKNYFRRSNRTDVIVLILIKINFEKNSLFIWCMDFVVSLSSPELATDVHNRLRR